MDWDDIRFFLALARAKSVRATGAQLDVAHSTVARRIELFEARIGARVFDRTPQGYLLTAAGRDVLHSAEQIEREMAGIERMLAGRDQQLAGELRVTMPIELAMTLMPDLAEFADAYPETDLEIEHTYSIADLSMREADVAIRCLRIGSQPPQHLIGRNLLIVHSAVYATPGYLSKNDVVNAPEAARWIGWADRERFPQWVLESEHPGIPARGRLDSGVTQLWAAKAGMGIAMLPCCLADEEPDLVRVTQTDPFPMFDLWVLSHPDLRDTPRLRVFRDFISTAIQEKQALFEGLPARQRRAR